tara:strand:- start:1266 stop:1520 length:255 start_codon:yes stop_codon:yes gene_type:complete
MAKNISPFLLIVTMEECGELVQACSKVYRHRNKKRDRKLLSEEVGDVLAMMNLLCEAGLVDLDIVENKRVAREKKMKKRMKKRR